MAYTAILAAVDGVVHECDRRDRRPRSGIADDPGNVPGPRHRHRRCELRRIDEPVQHARPFFLGEHPDYIGRRNTYMVFFVLGIILYSLVPTFGHIGSIPLFVGAFCIIISMYGGGFSTVPAYLRMSSAREVGAIHGALLTAWSAAGVLGPVLVNYIRAYQIDHGVPKAQAYSITMYIMCALLLIGFICNFAMRAVNSKYHYQAGAPAAAPAGSR